MASDLLKAHCKKLKLGGVLRVYDRIDFQHREQYLTAVLDAELEMRRHNRIKKLLKQAAFTNLKTLEAFDFETVTLPESISITALTDLVFLEKRENVLMLGAVGTGKTHLATALGVKACMQGTSVRFFRTNWPPFSALLSCQTHSSCPGIKYPLKTVMSISSGSSAAIQN
ncbi:MAG: ATP-binding protein [Dehalococcoidia bacterium]